MRAKVLEELENKEEVAGMKWKRFPYLNKFLKGHRDGELTVLTGSTGCGKTTFLAEYSLDLCMQGKKTLWGNFEVNGVRFAKLLLNQFAQLPLAENLNMFETFADQFEKLSLYFLKYHGPQKWGKVEESMKYAVNEFGVEHIILDNLQFMVGMVGVDRFTYQDMIIGSCRSFATNNNVHISVVIHPRKEITEELNMNSIYGGGKATQEADNVLIIQKSSSKKIDCKKYVDVCKNRYDGHIGSFPLYYNYKTQGFGLLLNESGSIKNQNESRFGKLPDRVNYNKSTTNFF
ncbi:twinkle protein-like protein [Leptotrombidium deliense]|uniref:Twinkle protein-like protein n=1 Tax=Leptotrombidium deliense TaxID=299467 RepID=A0A443SN89_9ACAR|nr:twinkle protein-like protein [Leptotrombidium deliense]